MICKYIYINTHAIVLIALVHLSGVYILIYAKSSIYYFWYCRFDLSCKAPEVLYEEVVEIDERVMLAEFFDENKSKEEIDALENRPIKNNQWIGKYSPNWPEAGVGKRIKGVTGEKVSGHLF